MASRQMYNNRYNNMHRVCNVLHTIGEGTATDISKHVNLSRQAINRILKDCITYGYVSFREVPHRRNVMKRLWTVSEWWTMNKNVHTQSLKLHDEMKQKCLL